MRNIKIAPSILAADYAHLADDLALVEKAGADFWHVDVMDGHFVPNITIGPLVVSALRHLTRLPFEAHLMISEPLKYADSFIQAGAGIITLHIETVSSEEFRELAESLHKRNIKIAVSLNPDTKVEAIKGVLDCSDMVLVMSVNPGFGGQKFMNEAVAKISGIRSCYTGDIAVDGGINDENSEICVKAGANILVAGTYIFRAKDKKNAIERLKKCQK